jgi:phenylalanyl-tRNA synthetase beta chain
MRTDLIGGLLDAAAHNLARGTGRVALFESGRAYLPQRAPAEGGVLDGAFAGDRSAPIAEPHRIGSVVIGELRPDSWREHPARTDFYEAKGLIELIAEALGITVALVPASRPFLHPSRAAEVRLGDRAVGWIGELHPSVLSRIDAPSGVAFELDAGPLIAEATLGLERYEDVTTHPGIDEDIALIADREVPAEEIRETILAAGSALLRTARVFDVYEGEQVPAGKRSLAIRLEFRAPDRTLTDPEVAAERGRIIAALESIGVSLRG